MHLGIVSKIVFALPALWSFILASGALVVAALALAAGVSAVAAATPELSNAKLMTPHARHQPPHHNSESEHLHPIISIRSIIMAQDRSVGRPAGRRQACFGVSRLQPSNRP